MDQSVAMITQDYVLLQITQVLSGGGMDDGVAWRIQRHAPDVIGARIRALGAGRASRRPEARLVAVRAAVSRPPFPIPLSAAGVLGALVAPLALDGSADPAAGFVRKGRLPADYAKPGGPAAAISLPLRGLADLAARRTGRSALDGRTAPAPDADVRLAADRASLAAGHTPAAPLAVDRAAAVLESRIAGLPVPGTLGLAALGCTRPAQPAAGLGTAGAALGADPPRDPLDGPLPISRPFGSDVAAALGAGRPPAGGGGPLAGVADPFRGPAFCGTGIAQAQPGCRRTDSTTGTQSLRLALFGPLAEPLAVVRLARDGIADGHDGASNYGTDRSGNFGPPREGGTSRGACVSPSGGARRKVLDFANPSAVLRNCAT